MAVSQRRSCGWIFHSHRQRRPLAFEQRCGSESDPVNYKSPGQRPRSRLRFFKHGDLTKTKEERESSLGRTSSQGPPEPPLTFEPKGQRNRSAAAPLEAERQPEGRRRRRKWLATSGACVLLFFFGHYEASQRSLLKFWSLTCALSRRHTEGVK